MITEKSRFYSALAYAGGLPFIACAHWGTYLYKDAQSPLNLFVTSNAATVFAWIVFLTASPRITLLVLVAVFVCLLAIDRHLFNTGLITRH